MGDFQDIFGAGASFDSIMYGINREHADAERRRARKEEADYEKQAEMDAWRSAMLARGYVEGPEFSSYEELSDWDRMNRRPHVRRRNSSGFLVFFTDKGNANDHSVTHSSKSSFISPRTQEDDIPF